MGSWCRTPGTRYGANCVSVALSGSGDLPVLAFFGAVLSK